jgi:hypothetical protein
MHIFENDNEKDNKNCVTKMITKFITTWEDLNVCIDF